MNPKLVKWSDDEVDLLRLLYRDAQPSTHVMKFWESLAAKLGSGRSASAMAVQCRILGLVAKAPDARRRNVPKGVVDKAPVVFFADGRLVMGGVAIEGDAEFRRAVAYIHSYLADR